MLAVGAAEAMPPAKETFDATGLHILPGAIDDHVHFRDPGYPHKEDWESGTAAAAFGGVTCVFDMPNTIPPTANGEILAAKHKIAASKAHIDFGLYGLLGDENLATVPELLDGGIIGFKLYMGNTFGKIASPDTGATLELFEVAAASGKRVSLHAENNDIMERRQKRLMAAGIHDQFAHLAARPPVVAVEAVSRAAILAEWTGARIHVLHISTADELRPLREAKARGVDITGETCPHYLMLSTDDYTRVPGVIAVNPPVRQKHNQEPIWQALLDGAIDVIATDHAPHAPEEKTRNDIWTVDCGFPGVETQMPLDADRSECRAHDGVRLCAHERLQPGAHLGALSAQGRAAAGLRCRHRHGRSRTRAHHPRCRDAIALEDLAVGWPQGEGPAGPYDRARPLRDEGPHVDGHQRLGPVGAHDPADAGAASAQRRTHDAGDHHCNAKIQHLPGEGNRLQ